MELLTRLIFGGALLFSNSGWAASYDSYEEEEVFKAPVGFRFCQSAREFRMAAKFLRNEPDLNLREYQSVQLAIEVAKGCDGSARRFARAFVLLKKSGVDIASSVRTAMTLAHSTDDHTDGFIELFKKIFLGNYLNLDFNNAFKLTLALTRDYKGDAKKLHKDFVELTDYCLSSKGLALDFKSCAEITVAMVKFTELFPQGVFPEFKRLYTYLRTNKRTGLSTKDALGVVPKVLAKGSMAPGNFIDTLQYFLDKSTSPANQARALELATQVADLSMVPDHGASK